MEIRPQPIRSHPGVAWQELASLKRQKIQNRIHETWLLDKDIISKAKHEKTLAGDFLDSLLDSETVRITTQDPYDLLEDLINGKETAVKVANAFCKRAVTAHQILPILLDFDCELALKEAQELDKYFQKHGKPKGPLHGLPISVKDQMHVRGLETTMGYVGWVETFEGDKDSDLYLKYESQIVQELRQLGAIPFAKASTSPTSGTTLVQTLRSGETDNNMLGYLWNPLNMNLTAGGSSGGEGAMAAFRGSAFGVGTDSGGSVSMPAAYNGVFSLKPSIGRLPWNGIPTNAPGQTLVPTVPGLVGNSLRLLRLAAKSIISTEPWRKDPSVVNLPWREKLESTAHEEGLTLGLLADDGIVAPQPPMARALQMAATAFKKAGHNIIPWHPPSHMTSSKIHKSIINADGMPTIVYNINLSGEPFVPEVADRSWGSPPISLHAYENITVRLEQYRLAYNSYWESTEKSTDTGRPVDAVLFPVGPHTATLPGKSYWWTYTSILNILDYCAVVVPVTRADKNIDQFDPNYKPHGDKDELNWKAYDPDIFEGAPANVMIVGRRLEEEKVLALAQVLVDALAAA